MYSCPPHDGGVTRAGWLAVALLVKLCAPLTAQDTILLSQDQAAVELRAGLTRVLAGLPNKTDVGLMVVDCGSRETWYARQPERPLKPASVMKLFTTAAALDHLGPGFTYETRLYVHDGELLVLGSGDPGLGDERIAGRRGRPLHYELDEWAGLLRERGVTSLRTIALDDSIFDKQFRHPDWPATQATAWYQAPVGGINFNDNCLDARFTAGNGRVELFLRPELPDSFIHNALKPATTHKPVATRPAAQDVFEFRGPVAHDDRFKPISVGRPAVFFGHALEHALAQRGVTLQGQVVRRVLTPEALAGAELIAVHTTSLDEVLWRCNTFSQNMFAECLLKSLTAYDTAGSRSGIAGSWVGGVRVAEAILRKLGVELDGAVFRDGSGLSHDNRVPAEQVVRLLLAMRRHPHAAHYVGSLAQPGQPGTLRSRRWNKPALQNRLRGKTGTLSGVNSLAGYVDRADGRTLAFALLINGTAPGAVREHVAEALAKAGIDKRP